MRPMFRVAKNHFKDASVVGVEVGTSAGMNALEVLKKWSNIEKLYCIDSYPTYSDFLDPQDQVTLRGVAIKNFVYKPKINLIMEDSVDAAKQFKLESIDFVYIDANHAYKSVEEDIFTWLPKIKKGGLIGGHDYEWTDKENGDDIAVKNAVDNIFGDRVMYNIDFYGYDPVAETGYLDSDWWIFL